MQTRNPALRRTADAFSGPYAQGAPVNQPGAIPYPGGTFASGGHARTFTVDGAVSKAAILLILLVLSAAATWTLVVDERGIPNPAVGGAILVPVLIGLGIAIYTSFRPLHANVTGPAYAIVQGVVVGAISALYNAVYDGIVVQAVMLTVGVLAVMLGLYRARVIRVTEKFRSIVVAAVFAILLTYLVNIVLTLFGASIPFVHSSGPLGIGFSVVVVAVAAMFLLLDFDFMEQGARNGADPRLEWYAGFSLIVTLIWLYLEILRLLSKLRSD